MNQVRFCDCIVITLEHGHLYVLPSLSRPPYPSTSVAAADTLGARYIRVVTAYVRTERDLTAALQEMPPRGAALSMRDNADRRIRDGAMRHPDCTSIVELRNEIDGTRAMYSRAGGTGKRGSISSARGMTNSTTADGIGSEATSRSRRESVASSGHRMNDLSGSRGDDVGGMTARRASAERRSRGTIGGDDAPSSSRGRSVDKKADEEMLSPRSRWARIAPSTDGVGGSARMPGALVTMVTSGATTGRARSQRTKSEKQAESTRSNSRRGSEASVVDDAMRRSSVVMDGFVQRRTSVGSQGQPRDDGYGSLSNHSAISLVASDATARLRQTERDIAITAARSPATLPRRSDAASPIISGVARRPSATPRRDSVSVPVLLLSAGASATRASVGSSHHIIPERQDMREPRRSESRNSSTTRRDANPMSSGRTPIGPSPRRATPAVIEQHSQRRATVDVPHGGRIQRPSVEVAEEQSDSTWSPPRQVQQGGLYSSRGDAGSERRRRSVSQGQRIDDAYNQARADVRGREEWATRPMQQRPLVVAAERYRDEPPARMSPKLGSTPTNGVTVGVRRSATSSSGGASRLSTVGASGDPRSPAADSRYSVTDLRNPGFADPRYTQAAAEPRYPAPNDPRYGMRHGEERENDRRGGGRSGR